MLVCMCVKIYYKTLCCILVRTDDHGRRTIVPPYECVCLCVLFRAKYNKVRYKRNIMLLHMRKCTKPLVVVGLSILIISRFVFYNTRILCIIIQHCGQSLPYIVIIL